MASDLQGLWPDPEQRVRVRTSEEAALGQKLIALRF